MKYLILLVFLLGCTHHKEPSGGYALVECETMIGCENLGVFKNKEDCEQLKNDLNKKSRYSYICAETK